MVTLHDAIRALNPSVININGIDAYDQNFVAIQYDLEAAQAKLAELQAAEVAAHRPKHLRLLYRLSDDG